MEASEIVGSHPMARPEPGPQFGKIGEPGRGYDSAGQNPPMVHAVADGLDQQLVRVEEALDQLTGRLAPVLGVGSPGPDRVMTNSGGAQPSMPVSPLTERLAVAMQRLEQAADRVQTLIGRLEI